MKTLQITLWVNYANLEEAQRRFDSSSCSYLIQSSCCTKSSIKSTKNPDVSATFKWLFLLSKMQMHPIVPPQLGPSLSLLFNRVRPASNPDVCKNTDDKKVKKNLQTVKRSGSEVKKSTNKISRLKTLETVVLD